MTSTARRVDKASHPGQHRLAASGGVARYRRGRGGGGGAASYDSAPAQDTTKTALTGMQAGQAVIVILAVLAVTNEYSTGMIRVTFIAMPRRLEVLAAKATVVGGLSLLAAT